MIRYFLDKQFLINKEEETHSYTKIKSITSKINSRNFMIFDERNNDVFYVFLPSGCLVLEDSTKEQVEDTKRMFFPIIEEDTPNLTYCELTHKQIIEFFNLDKFEDKEGIDSIFNKIEELERNI